MSPELVQYLSLLETERGMRMLLGTLTATQEKRLGALKESVLLELTPSDKMELRVAMGQEKSMEEISQEGEARWHDSDWSRGCY